MADGRGRREPTFDARADAAALDLRLSHADRAGGGMPKAKSRSKRGGAPMRVEEPREPRRTKPTRRRRSILSRLVYGVLVLGLWSVIGLAGLIAYHAAQLPPIDQLAVP